MSSNSLIADLLTRLAPLGPTIPVLTPEQIELPLTGRKPGAAGGLSGYLAAHPEGYIQLSYPSGLISNALTDTGLMQLEAVALTAGAAAALAQRVRDLIGGLPTRPTPYIVFIPPQTLAESGFARVITTYQTRTIGV